MFNFIKEFLTSGSGLSSKRAITFGSFLLLAIAFLCNLFFGLTIEQYMFETISYVTIGGLGFTASEYLGGLKTKKENKSEEEAPE